MTATKNNPRVAQLYREGIDGQEIASRMRVGVATVYAAIHHQIPAEEIEQIKKNRRVAPAVKRRGRQLRSQDAEDLLNSVVK